MSESMTDKLKAQKIEMLEQELRQLELKHRQLKRVNQQFCKISASVQDEAETSKLKFRHLQSVNKQYADRIKKLQDQYQNCKLLVQQLNSRIDKLLEEKQQYQQHLAMLKQQLSLLKSRDMTQEKLREKQHSLKMKEIQISLQKARYEKLVQNIEESQLVNNRKHQQQMNKLIQMLKELELNKITKQKDLLNMFNKAKYYQSVNKQTSVRFQEFTKNANQEKESIAIKFREQVSNLKKQNQRLKVQLKHKDLQIADLIKTNRKKIAEAKEKTDIVQQAANNIKSKYEKQNALIIESLCTKQDQISNLKKQANRSRSKANLSGLLDSYTSSKKSTRLNSQTPNSSQKDCPEYNSTVLKQTTSDNRHIELRVTRK